MSKMTQEKAKKEYQKAEKNLEKALNARHGEKETNDAVWQNWIIAENKRNEAWRAWKNI